MRLTLDDLEKIPYGEFRNPEILARVTARGISTDSRGTRPGDLFFALRGEKYDGHKFVDAAFARGAAAAVVEKGFDGSTVERKPLILVESTTAALGALARIYRDRFSIPFLAVGGSNGKTTTKEMIARVLGEKYNVLSTIGNLNNQIGVPLTLFRLSRRHDVAVIEVGTNHPGEIAALCGTLAPTHGVITSIGREHLEFFGSVDGVAKEEGELFRSLASRPGGMALVNADDPRIGLAARPVGTRLAYGFRSRGASLRGRRVVLDGGGCARFEFRSAAMKGWQSVRLMIPGKHNALNALAAAAAGVAFHVPPRRISSALQSCRTFAKRMESLSIGGVTVLNDTYNANPDSAIAALATLASLRAPGKKIAVLADMKELGSHGAAGHADVGKAASALGLDYVLTYGDLARHIHSAAGKRGAIHYEKKSVLAEELVALLRPGDAVLVKGSRSMRMEDIVAVLREKLTPVRRK